LNDTVGCSVVSLSGVKHATPPCDSNSLDDHLCQLRGNASSTPTVESRYTSSIRSVVEEEEEAI
jgi:hypothetical protein